MSDLLYYSENSIPHYVIHTKSTAIYALLFFPLLLIIFSLSLILSRHKLRVLHYSAIIAAIVMEAWSYLMYESPRHISFDEVFPAWVIAAGFFILNALLIHRRLYKSIPDNSGILDQDFG
ncbi:MAG TPA: hypothetical protein DEP18_06685 [Flavobacteriales bacterium]|nr:hypothetical protein [Flavobacteriales bacterium]